MSDFIDIIGPLNVIIFVGNDQHLDKVLHFFIASIKALPNKINGITKFLNIQNNIHVCEAGIIVTDHHNEEPKAQCLVTRSVKLIKWPNHARFFRTCRCIFCRNSGPKYFVSQNV